MNTNRLLEALKTARKYVVWSYQQNGTLQALRDWREIDAAIRDADPSWVPRIPPPHP